MDENNKTIVYNKQMLSNTLYENEDASLRMTSNLYVYIIWMLVAIVIVCLTMVNTGGIGGKSVSGITYVVVAIGIVMFLIYLYNKLSSVNVEIN